MAPNLNKEKVQVKAQMLRQIAKQESQSVQARDKAALEKQRYVASIRVIGVIGGVGKVGVWERGRGNVVEADAAVLCLARDDRADQAKAKADKQKKAQKQERRA
jgi:hypothetical protein